jgi:hypothetical protein
MDMVQFMLFLCASTLHACLPNAGSALFTSGVLGWLAISHNLHFVTGASSTSYGVEMGRTHHRCV